MSKSKFASEEYLKLKKETSRLSSLANKRLVRLEKNNLLETPAYKKWVDYKGGVKFSVKGKTYNELQQEMARLNQFINAKSSTIRGANSMLKDMAKATGIKYGSVKELQQKSKNFFTLADKIEQYLRNVEGSASAIGYQKIWDTINTYVKDQNIDLGKANMDMDNFVDKVKELVNYELIEDGYEGYFDGKEYEYFK